MARAFRSRFQQCPAVDEIVSFSRIRVRPGYTREERGVMAKVRKACFKVHERS